MAVSTSTGRTPRATPLRLVRRVLPCALLFAVLAAGSADARPGDLDLSFGVGGFVTTDFGTNDGATDVAVQPDGKIVAVGFLSGDFKIARYDAAGSLDPTFDDDGLVTTGFGAPAAATSVAIQPDGKIVAAGFTEAGPNPANFAVVRYNADGSPDMGFDDDGMLFTDFGDDDVATDVAVQPDGRIIVAGSTVSGQAAANFAFARYHANGSPDNSFDVDGVRTIEFGGLDAVSAAAVQADGKVVAAGFSDTNGELDIAVARLTAAGMPDASFGANGRLTTDIGDVDGANGLALHADQRIVVSGSTTTGAGTDLAIVRYHNGGELDPSFGAGGVLTRDLGGQDESSDVALQPDGKIVAQAGGSFSVARFNPDGSPDGGFGTGGFARVDFGPSSFATALTLQPDGQIVAAGITDAGPNPDNFGLVRLAGADPPVVPPPACRGRAATIIAVPGVRTKGTPGADVIVGTTKRDRVNSGPGRDVVCTLGGRARVKAGSGRDLVIGGNRRDVLIGAGGRDVLRGKRGNDRLVGGAGADLLVGGKGRADRCIGGPGRDRARGC